MWRRWDKDKSEPISWSSGKNTVGTSYFMIHNSGFIAANQTVILSDCWADALHLSFAFLTFLIAHTFYLLGTRISI